MLGEGPCCRASRPGEKNHIAGNSGRYVGYCGKSPFWRPTDHCCLNFRMVIGECEADRRQCRRHGVTGAVACWRLGRPSVVVGSDSRRVGVDVVTMVESEKPERKGRGVEAESSLGISGPAMATPRKPRQAPTSFLPTLSRESPARQRSLWPVSIDPTARSTAVPGDGLVFWTSAPARHERTRPTLRAPRDGRTRHAGDKFTVSPCHTLNAHGLYHRHPSINRLERDLDLKLEDLMDE
ncbi:hypothetical protein BXZ70DRAFT_429967 [Cristinia sonorae]|uniref:Uncharacterized protein n=1 Tax=Cristinia sonorae TaxID=1940300 RepID=A0A8K0UWK7_9AGAR|nr:hypothetical protein BXZ70DRAFT_429967 [Cristinia sonorae]